MFSFVDLCEQPARMVSQSPTSTWDRWSILMIAEERILLLSNLDRASSILQFPISIFKLTKGLLTSLRQLDHTCGIRTLSPGATLGVTLLPSLSSPPGPTASTFASLSSLTLCSGSKMPPAVLVSALILWTRMRSRRGARDLMDLSAVVWSAGQSLIPMSARL